MTNPWLIHLKKFHAEHPELSYKQAMKSAKSTYKPLGKTLVKSSGSKTMVKQKGGSSRLKSNSNDMSKVKLLSDYRKLKKQSGGNPALIQALAQAGPEIAKGVGAIADNVGKVVDNQLERGYQKNRMTGKYEQIADKRTRKTQRQYLANAQNLVKKYGGSINDYLPGGSKFFE